MIYGSVCSGIEAATAAWHPLGWKPAFFSEIEPFPRAVLQHHYPDTPLHGDFTTIESGDYDPIELLVGGTPCQSFSIAGLRGGMGDDRGNLALEFLRLAQRLKPRWLVFENVPGVLSSNGGRDFGSIIGGMGELGYGTAYRVLDAQYTRTRAHPAAVPQRRRRVFVVGYFGDWRRAGAVLFDRESLRRDSAPRRTGGKEVAADVAPCLVSSGRGVERTGDTRGQDPVIACAPRPYTKQSIGEYIDCGVASTCAARDFKDATDLVAFDCKGTQVQTETGGAMMTLRSMSHSNSHANGGGHAAVAIQERAISENIDAGPQGAGFRTDGAAYTMEARPVPQIVSTASAVRRLTPRECERLMGFPDDFTNIPWRGKPEAPDGHRYKALGNSMAVNVMELIGERIAMVDKI